MEAEAGGVAAAGDAREGDWEREGSQDRERVRYAEGKDLPPLRVRPRVGQSFCSEDTGYTLLFSLFSPSHENPRQFDANAS